MVSRWRLLFYLVILSNTLRIFWIPLGTKIRWTGTRTLSQPRWNGTVSIQECKRTLSRVSGSAVLNNRSSSSPPIVPGGLGTTAEWRSARHIVPDFCDVDRLDVTTLSLDTFLSKYVKARRPVVLAGAARHWPAAAQWRRSQLLATRRDQEWRVVRPPYLDPSGGAYRFETLSDFLEEMASTTIPMPNVSANTRVPASYLFEMVQGLNLSHSTGRCAAYEAARDACAGNQVPLFRP
ncbi:hypothetical protein CYMTET_37530 [Cymbomonas tetramitiformis]|uniref:Uncharacterized protein n=1 Tax=Cymbomonas tetramitiformis TaxID=36881 RepID=A0AAE0F6C7_9CHLO|nr:hypothetical protein CYMTET_37530 [Cymbomonas tetramitiformis]